MSTDRSYARGGIRPSGQTDGTAVYNKTQMRLYVLALVTVIAVVGGTMACDRVPLTAPTASTITVSVDQTTLPLNGQATVRAVVIESGGIPVHNGTEVTFATTLGNFNPPTAATVNGVATTTFLAGSISGTTKINAFSGGASTGSGNSSGGGVEVKIGAAAAGSLAVVATPSSVSQSGGTVTISALVLDASNNPLPGVSVLFTTTSGALSATTALSDANGVARTTLNTTTTATVKATASSTASGEVTVTVSAAPSITLTVPDTGNVGVPVVMTVTATAGTGNSSPRQIETLTIDYGDGSVETRTNVTGSVGLTHTYSSPRAYTVTATARDVAGNTAIASDVIVISPAPLPTISAFSANPNPVPASANGVTSITVTAAPSSASAPIQSVVVRKADGTVIYSGTQGGTFTYQFQPAGSGATPITATVTDINGNKATATTVVVVQ